MRTDRTQWCGVERTVDVVVRRPGLMHLGICALLVACGDKDPTEPPDVVLPPPDFTLVGSGIVTHELTSDLWVHGTVAYTGMDDVPREWSPRKRPIRVGRE